MDAEHDWETSLLMPSASVFSEIRARARHVVGPVAGICMVAYFSYHVVQGERGLMAWMDLQGRIEDARQNRDRMRNHRLDWERRVRLLHPATLDPDLLEERARLMLNFGAPDDVVVLAAGAPE